MAVLFLAQTGPMAGRDDWVAEAHHQFMVHIRFLVETETGLYFHGWTFEGRHNFTRARWARGNPWVTITQPELFVIAPPSDAVVRRYLTPVLRSQGDALGSLQAADGMFYTLLDDPASPVEASATAGIGYGVLTGCRLCLLDDDHLAIALVARAAILQCIGPDGILADVSGGTSMATHLISTKSSRMLRHLTDRYWPACFFKRFK
jgi:unsaturated rhamnogalacturonyl hydrolase